MYTSRQLQTLFRDYRKAKPEAKFMEFIAIFIKFAMKKTILKVINELNRIIQAGSKKDRFHDPAITIHRDEKQSFLEPKDTPLRPSTPLKDVPLHVLPLLLKVMKAMAKPISKRSTARYVLGSVGKEARRKGSGGKEEESKENLKEVYENPVWRNFLKSIDDLIRSLSKPRGKERING